MHQFDALFGLATSMMRCLWRAIALRSLSESRSSLKIHHAWAASIGAAGIQALIRRRPGIVVQFTNHHRAQEEMECNVMGRAKNNMNTRTQQRLVLREIASGENTAHDFAGVEHVETLRNAFSDPESWWNLRCLRLCFLRLYHDLAYFARPSEVRDVPTKPENTL